MPDSMPQIVSRFIQVHVVRAGAGGPEYLVLRRAADMAHYPNVWQVITGSIDGSESATETAHRELAEETSLVPVAFYSVPYLASFFRPLHDEISLAPVFAAIVASDAVPVLSKEHQAFEWLSFDEAMHRLVLPSDIEGTRIIHQQLLVEGKLDHHAKI